MPPPLVRHTLKSASRASVNDEKIRQEKVTAQMNDYTGSRSKSKDCSSRVCGTPVFRIDQSQQNNTLQKEKRIEKEDKWKSGEFSRQSEWRDHMGSNTSHNKGVARSSGATGSSSRDLPIQNPSGGILDPYGYTRISASQAKLYRDNLDFYLGKIRSKPIPGQTIEEMLKWKGNYGMLERNHSYIQWLFPIPEGNGLNMYAQQLYEHEAQAIRDDKIALKRVLMAYKMMLDFYGMQLVSSLHGTVKRSSKGWEERYDHLNRSRHNLLRITRILKSLGELGYERLQAPWVEFLIEEAVINKELPNLNGSCLMHWIMAVKDDRERETLYRKANGLPISQDNVDMDGINSESEDDDKEGDEIETKDLDQNGAEMSKLTLKSSEKNHKTGDDELLKHENKAKAMLKQTKGVESVNAASVSNEKGEKPDEKDNAKVTRNETMDKTATGAEFVKSTSTSMSKLEPEKPTEKSANDKTDETSTEGMKSTNARAETSVMKLQSSQLPCDNLEFYKNDLNSRPSPGYTIETMLKYRGQYEFFEGYPYFIHWLFPTREKSMRNPEAQPLYDYEAEAIKNDDIMRSRFLQAYTMMLDFFGMRLIDENTGHIERVPETFKRRYRHLDTHRHNFLRITRILVALGELGFERFQVPLIDFFIEEGIKNKRIQTLKGSCIMHWINSIKDDGEKQAMFKHHQQLAGYNADIDSQSSSEEETNVDITHYDDDFGQNRYRTTGVRLSQQSTIWKA